MNVGSATQNGFILKTYIRGAHMPSILLIEDTEDIRKMYTFGLQHAGFEVTAASNAGEALLRVEERLFDVIILDMMMPGMSGLEFLATYDVKTVSPATKLVVLSSVDNPSIIERAQAFRIDGYLVKSDYEPTALADYIRGLLVALPKEPTAAAQP
jgi:CheY-like chemotaxis protein